MPAFGRQANGKRICFAESPGRDYGKSTSREDHVPQEKPVHPPPHLGRPSTSVPYLTAEPFMNRSPIKSSPQSTGLRFQVVEDYPALSDAAASIMARELSLRPAPVLCASAGGTPTGAYHRLAEIMKAKSTRATTRTKWMKQLRVVQIDEWCGLPAHHPASCRVDLLQKLIRPLGLPAAQFLSFRTEAADPEKECLRMRRWLAANGPIDVCILGLGHNGHVAMNEPGGTAQSEVHVATLAPSSLKHPMLQGLKTKLRYGLSLGLGDILRSRTILLLVNGAQKRYALERLLDPKVDPRYPASFLWLHPNVTVLCDRAAAPRKLRA